MDFWLKLGARNELIVDTHQKLETNIYFIQRSNQLSSSIEMFTTTLTDYVVHNRRSKIKWRRWIFSVVMLPGNGRLAMAFDTCHVVNLSSLLVLV